MNIKKRFVPAVSSDYILDGADFESILSERSLFPMAEGSVVKGRVVDVDKEVVVVDVGLKNEGRIPLEEFLLREGADLPEIGDFVDVFIEKIESKNGRTVLSRAKAIRQELWVVLKDMHERGELVNGVIFGRVKGGFTVDLAGVIAFLPGSQVDVKPIKDITPLMNISQPFQILKMDEKLGNIVVSRRAILEESRAEARNEMLSQVKEGVILEGTVKNITDYGAFLDLGTVDGLLHVTDISWSRINHPSEVLKIGQKVSVIVIKFNEDTKRISLGMKQLESNPWEGIESDFPVGQKMIGKVSNIADYGIFVELRPGIEGLVHSTEISWSRANQNPRKLVKVGQEIEFVILEVDTEKHRISLSMKQCRENPWQKFADSHQIGDIMELKIRHVLEYALIVELDEEIDGVIHAIDLSWLPNAEDELKNYKKGDVVRCQILTIDVEKERVSLGVKQLSEDPFYEDYELLNKWDALEVEVVNISEDGIEVKIGKHLTSVIKRNELSSDKLEQNPDKYRVGQKIVAKVIIYDKSSRKLSLSIRAHELEEKKKALKEYSSNDSTSNLGEIIGAVIK
jgi:small subunit ribosomal protein S1